MPVRYGVVSRCGLLWMGRHSHPTTSALPLPPPNSTQLHPAPPPQTLHRLPAGLQAAWGREELLLSRGAHHGAHRHRHAQGRAAAPPLQLPACRVPEALLPWRLVLSVERVSPPVLSWHSAPARISCCRRCRCARTSLLRCTWPAQSPLRCPSSAPTSTSGSSRRAAAPASETKLHRLNLSAARAR